MEKRLYLYAALLILIHGLWGLFSPPLVRLSVAAEKGAPAKFSLNTADAEQLQTIKGIGPKTAAKIIQQREALKSFTNWLEVLEVKGIGPKKLELLKKSAFLETKPPTPPETRHPQNGKKLDAEKRKPAQ